MLLQPKQLFQHNQMNKQNSQHADKQPKQTPLALPPISYAYHQSISSHCLKDQHEHRQSDFIRNMKRAKSLMIAQKYKKQKIAMKYNIGGHKRKNHQLSQSPCSDRSRSFERSRMATQPATQCYSINISVMEKPQYKNAFGILSRSKEQTECRVSENKKEKNISFEIPDQIRNQSSNKKPISHHSQLSSIKPRYPKNTPNLQKITNSTRGWKLGRWEVKEETQY